MGSAIATFAICGMVGFGFGYYQGYKDGYDKCKQHVKTEYKSAIEEIIEGQKPSRPKDNLYELFGEQIK